MSDQFSFYGIHVHVVEFFDELALTPDIEIVEAGLPELREEVAGLSKWKAELLGGYFLRGLRRSRRDTSCFKTCMTVEGVPLDGSPMSR